MRAHTITTKARVGARGCRKRTIVPGGILALSFAVVLLAATASSASTTPTPPAPPLTLSVSGGHSYLLEKGNKYVKFDATTSNNAALVATGSKIKRTTKQLYAGTTTKVKAKFKHPKRLYENACRYDSEGCRSKARRLQSRAKIKVKATAVFGQTATDKLKFRFYRTQSL
jgi:hypothetical protein